MNNKRRLQKIKGGSYIISLPTTWIKKNNLDVKSELEVYETADGLKIKPERKINDERELLLKDNLDEILYLISVYYMQGISRIIVKSENVISPEVKKALRELQLIHPGLQIDDETFNKISFTVNSPISTDLISIVTAFRDKIMRILLDLESINTFNKEMLDDLLTRCDITMNDYKVIIRNISLGIQLDDKYNFMIPSKDVVLFAILMRDMGRFITHLKTFLKITDNIDKYSISTITEMFKKATDMFFTENLSEIQLIRKKVKELESNCSLNTESCKEIIRMASYIIAIMDDAVHKSVRVI
ncbi:AbrB/MazE/SpoVT family DNA-binding domain-containing protein [Acidianus sulfidivorans JP7]|uniref:AbrB family transcriptional regulator n=1 Tax=Acidianus sulfidivorans JP7 TaxID=619593 RepID=A0A2U9IJI7_9CREN|nr:AbrB/MazE/SpoVT family DNA-binding domain-containing protein [Acidianus sulfidivorans]AWR96192.1 AbrB/MazE/SpoVT family DNA-binding domain-containing protein [Acidianus sulfidivorans JP7]